MTFTLGTLYLIRMVQMEVNVKGKPLQETLD